MSKGAIHFACVACGRCCNSPPQMSIEEALQLYDVFPLVLQLNAYRSDTDYNQITDRNIRIICQQIRDNAAAFGGLQFKSASGVPYVAVLGANVLNPTGGPCPALADDGRCRIHQRRPNMCRAVPFNYELDARLAIRLMRQQHRNDCDWSSTAPVVMRDGEIVDPQYVEDRAASCHGQRRDSELLALLRANHAHAQYDGIGINALLDQALRQQGEVCVPFIALLEMMRGLDKVGKLPSHYVLPSPEDFRAAQKRVTESANLSAAARSGGVNAMATVMS